MLLLNQIAIGTDDVYKTSEAVKIYGGQITREPGPLPGISTKITACMDPDGWKTVSLKFYSSIFVMFFIAYELYQLAYLYFLFRCSALKISWQASKSSTISTWLNYQKH
jgi:hypothetical protein